MLVSIYGLVGRCWACLGIRLIRPIVFGIGNAIALTQPSFQIQQLTSFGTKGSKDISFPLFHLATHRTFHGHVVSPEGVWKTRVAPLEGLITMPSRPLAVLTFPSVCSRPKPRRPSLREASGQDWTSLFVPSPRFSGAGLFHSFSPEKKQYENIQQSFRYTCPLRSRLHS